MITKLAGPFNTTSINRWTETIVKEFAPRGLYHTKLNNWLDRNSHGRDDAASFSTIPLRFHAARVRWRVFGIHVMIRGRECAFW